MNSQIIAIIKKDALEILRDKTTFIMFLLSVVIFPVISLFTNTSFQQIKNEVATVKIYTSTDSELKNVLSDFFYSDYSPFTIDELEISSNKFLESDSIKYDLLCEINGNKICVYCNTKSFHSIKNSSVFSEQFQKYYINAIKDEDIISLEIDDLNGNYIEIASTTVSFLMPCILIFILLQSNSLLASDLIAGEKERGTLELLFCSGMNRRNIFIGKLYILIGNGWLNLTVSLLSLMVCEKLTGNGIFVDNTQLWMLYYVIMLLFICLVSVVLLSVSLMSKTIKQAQILNGIVELIPTALSILVFFDLIEIPLKKCFYVPVLNLVLTIKDLYISHIFELDEFIVTVLINIVLLLGIIKISTKYIKGDKVLQ